MLKKVVKYTDFNGNPAEDTLYFNLTEAELVRLDVKYKPQGGFEGVASNLDPENNPEEVLTLFEDIIQASYGVRSEDGKYFIKDSEEAKLFFQSAVYSALFVELLQDADVASAFVNGIISSTAPIK